MFALEVRNSHWIAPNTTQTPKTNITNDTTKKVAAPNIQSINSSSSSATMPSTVTVLTPASSTSSSSSSSSSTASTNPQSSSSSNSSSSTASTNSQSSSSSSSSQSSPAITPQTTESPAKESRIKKTTETRIKQARELNFLFDRAMQPFLSAQQAKGLEYDHTKGTMTIPKGIIPTELGFQVMGVGVKEGPLKDETTLQLKTISGNQAPFLATFVAGNQQTYRLTLGKKPSGTFDDFSLNISTSSQEPAPYIDDTEVNYSTPVKTDIPETPKTEKPKDPDTTDTTKKPDQPKGIWSCFSAIWKCIANAFRLLFCCAKKGN
jgi:hypothetical protein